MHMYTYMYIHTHTLKYTLFLTGRAKIVDLTKERALYSWTRFYKDHDEWVEFRHIVSASVV